MAKGISVCRNEDKYLIPYIDAASLKKTLSKVLEIDSNVKDDGYLVRNLYFDSINNMDFSQKLAGVLERKKIRLRVYDPKSDKCKLEVKKKRGEIQHKISLWIKKEHALKLIKGDYSVLIKYFNLCKEAKDIYAIMVLGCYRPVCLVEYRRMAFTQPLYNTRITIDTDIKSSESNFDLFKVNQNFTKVKNDGAILEVKYNQTLVKFISDILKPYHLTNVAVSKYMMARKVYYDFNF